MLCSKWEKMGNHTIEELPSHHTNICLQLPYLCHLTPMDICSSNVSDYSKINSR
jgi:hypothetical protein